MKREFPGRIAKLVFDNRDHRTNELNARAITNFFVGSSLGLGYDSILRVPMFAVSQGHNYGLHWRISLPPSWLHTFREGARSDRFGRR
jgi:hypothetical protein